MPFPLVPVALASSALAGGLASYFSGKNTNKTNVALQRETNALNYQMHREDIANQRYMFQRQLDYQDPSNLRSLLENAGYNPAALVAGGSSALGSAPSTSAPSSIPAQSPQVYDAVTPAVNSAMSSLVQSATALNELQEAKGKDIDNKTKVDMNLANLQLLKAKKKIDDQTFNNLYQEWRFNDVVWNDRVQQVQQQAYKTQQEAQKAEAEAALTNYMLTKKAPEEVNKIKAEIQKIAAEKGYYEAMEYATRAGVPSSIALNYANAFRATQEGNLLNLDYGMTKDSKQWIEKAINEGGIVGNAAKIALVLKALGIDIGK